MSASSKKLVLIALVVITSSCRTLVEPSTDLLGIRDGNGGDLVFCRSTDTNSFHGFYSLDYLLTFHSSNQNSDLVAVRSWDESSQRILAKLGEFSKDLQRSFKDFLDLQANTTNQSLGRYWSESGYGLVKLDDQEIERHVPLNCREGNGNDPRIWQAVRREVLPTRLIQYSFDPMIRFPSHVLIDGTQQTVILKDNQPLQYSFLMVHEWLWDHLSIASEDQKRTAMVNLREINRYLHSTAFDQQSPEERASTFKSRGMVYAVGPTPPDNVALFSGQVNAGDVVLTGVPNFTQFFSKLSFDRAQFFPGSYEVYARVGLAPTFEDYDVKQTIGEPLVITGSNSRGSLKPIYVMIKGIQSGHWRMTFTRGDSSSEPSNDLKCQLPFLLQWSEYLWNSDHQRQTGGRDLKYANFYFCSMGVEPTTQIASDIKMVSDIKKVLDQCTRNVREMFCSMLNREAAIRPRPSGN